MNSQQQEQQIHLQGYNNVGVSISEDQIRELAATHPQPVFKLIAWIPLGKSLIIGRNEKKSAPFHRRQYNDQEPLFSKHNLMAIDYKPHAETQVIRTALHRGINLKGKDIYVLRIKRSGTIGTSRPCIHCMQLIKEQGIRFIHYIGEDLMWHQERITSDIQ